MEAIPVVAVDSRCGQSTLSTIVYLFFFHYEYLAFLDSRLSGFTYGHNGCVLSRLREGESNTYIGESLFHKHLVFPLSP